MNKKWKLAFLGLLTLNVIIVLILAIALVSPVKDEPLPKAQPEKDGFSPARRSRR